MWSGFASALVLLIIAAVPPGQEGEGTDPYSVNLVRVAVKLGSQRVTVGKVQTHVLRLGDAVSVAVLKAFSPSELADPATVRSILPVIALAFERPDLISRDEDREPRVTEFFLTHLESDANDVALKAEIARVREAIREKLSGSHQAP